MTIVPFSAEPVSDIVHSAAMQLKIATMLYVHHLTQRSDNKADTADTDMVKVDVGRVESAYTCGLNSQHPS